jgi:hypothetical protein
MTGAHPLWSDRPASPMKRSRVRLRMTLARLAELVDASIATVQRLEARDEGSDDLRDRVGRVLGLDLRRAPSADPEQMALPVGSSS